MNSNPPTREEIQRYYMLTTQLMEVRLSQQQVNEEIERSIELLQKQKDELQEQDWALQDFISNLDDCEQRVAHLSEVLKKLNAAPLTQEETVGNVHPESEVPNAPHNQ